MLLKSLRSLTVRPLMNRKYAFKVISYHPRIPPVNRIEMTRREKPGTLHNFLERLRKTITFSGSGSQNDWQNLMALPCKRRRKGKIICAALLWPRPWQTFFCPVAWQKCLRLAKCLKMAKMPRDGKNASDRVISSP